MIKKTKLLFVAIVLLIGLTQCSKEEFLEDENKTEIGSENDLELSAKFGDSTFNQVFCEVHVVFDALETQENIDLFTQYARDQNWFSFILVPLPDADPDPIDPIDPSDQSDLPMPRMEENTPTLKFDLSNLPRSEPEGNTSTLTWEDVSVVVWRVPCAELPIPLKNRGTRVIDARRTQDDEEDDPGIISSTVYGPKYIYID